MSVSRTRLQAQIRIEGDLGLRACGHAELVSQRTKYEKLCVSEMMHSVFVVFPLSEDTFHSVGGIVQFSYFDMLSIVPSISVYKLAMPSSPGSNAVAQKRNAYCFLLKCIKD